MSLNQLNTRLLWRLQPLLLLVMLCAFSLQAHALSSITILTTTQSTSVNHFVDELETALSNNKNLEVHRTKSNSGISINIPDQTIVIAVGTQALSYASNLSNTTPVIGVLVPKINFERIFKDSGRSPKYFSAIYLDQPFNRQLALIKSIFPHITDIGVLLGPVSQFKSNDLQSAAEQLDLNVNLKLVNNKSELQSNLEALMLRKQVLLAIPDPLIYTRETAQTILITSYRHQSPVIGFSQSYVKSGAVAATFTSPKQFALEIGNIINGLPTKQFRLPPPRGPKTFSIQVNYQVARSLGLAIPNKNVLYKKVLGRLQ